MKVFRFTKYRLILVAMVMVPLLSYGQEIDYDSLLQRIDTVENPVYKPVVSFSYGVLNFRGDVKNSLITPVTGNQAGMLMVSTFIDKKNQYFVANFNFMLGKLTANEYSHTDLTRNLNFETLLYSIGLNVEYRFGHLISQNAFIRPYVSLGIESINFSSKGDLEDADGVPYNYWSDGTIQNTPESAPGPAGSLSQLGLRAGIPPLCRIC